DTDYYQFSIPPGTTITLTLTAGATSGFGLGIYTTSGRQLVLSPGVKGSQQRITVSNSGTAAGSVVARVLRSTGSSGSYQLSLTR
ncbi:MAG: peptidase S8, partial [Burkholderiaceae bacterium]|nr:peptidase S8 [Burkholderiaceae bacterium]